MFCKSTQHYIHHFYSTTWLVLGYFHYFIYHFLSFPKLGWFVSISIKFVYTVWIYLVSIILNSYDFASVELIYTLSKWICFQTCFSYTLAFWHVGSSKFRFTLPRFSAFLCELHSIFRPFNRMWSFTASAWYVWVSKWMCLCVFNNVSFEWVSAF